MRLNTGQRSARVLHRIKTNSKHKYKVAILDARVLFEMCMSLLDHTRPKFNATISLPCCRSDADTAKKKLAAHYEL